MPARCAVRRRRPGPDCSNAHRRRTFMVAGWTAVRFRRDVDRHGMGSVRIVDVDQQQGLHVDVRRRRPASLYAEDQLEAGEESATDATLARSTASARVPVGTQMNAGVVSLLVHDDERGRLLAEAIRRDARAARNGIAEVEAKRHHHQTSRSSSGTGVRRVHLHCSLARRRRDRVHRWLTARSRRRQDLRGDWHDETRRLVRRGRTAYRRAGPGGPDFLGCEVLTLAAFNGHRTGPLPNRTRRQQNSFSPGPITRAAGT